MKYDECFYGIPEIKFISHGEHADPEIEYNGVRFNYFEIEDCMHVRYMQDSKGHDSLEDYIKANTDELVEVFDSISGLYKCRYTIGNLDTIVKDYLSRICIERENRHILNFDFEVVEVENDEMSLKHIFIENELIFGIKEIHTGFDNEYGVDLFCDYYGGGYGHHVQLDPDFPEEHEGKIMEMVRKTLDSWGYCNISELRIVGEYYE